MSSCWSPRPESPLPDALGLYWRIEKAVRKLESQTGSVVGMTGAICALRSDLFAELPQGTLLDDVLIPMNVARAGYRVVFQPLAIARDSIFADEGREFRRKVRTLTGNYQLLRLAQWLVTPRNPLLFRFISHKLLRLVVPFLLVLMLVSSGFGHHLWLRAAFGLQLVFYGLAALGALSRSSRKIKPVAIAHTFVALNLAATLALRNALFRRGKRLELAHRFTAYARQRRNVVGTGLGHYIPIVAYLGFWVMCLVSLSGKPIYGLYYMLPFIPYRTMRDRFEVFPLGSNMLTILVVCVIIGGLLKHKKLPPSKLYLTWLLCGLYLYISLWLGTMISNVPMPLWLGDANFVAWKDYMVLPLLLLAAALTVEDRKAVKTVILVCAFSLFLVDRSSLLESLSRSWTSFDESKRSAGPVVIGSNHLAAFLAQFAMFYWGLARCIKGFKGKLVSYGLVALTVMTTLYTFSRGAYLALIVAALVLAIVKDRKLLVLIGVFLLTWQTVVPTAVTERVTMTRDANGELEQSAQERIDLWTQSEALFISSPVVGRGFGTFQFGEHAANLKDTHNWYVKVLVETGLIGGAFFVAILAQLFVTAFRLFRKASDPLYQGLGLGLLVATVSCAVANCFGDRWTYIEINGLLWVLFGAGLRALQLSRREARIEAASEAKAGLPAHLGWGYQ